MMAINRDFLALGKLFMSAESSVRDSQLTRLLQNSFGGNAHTVVIACVSPAEGKRAALKETNDVLQRENAQLRDENTQLKARLAAYEAQSDDERDEDQIDEEESLEVYQRGLKGTQWSVVEDKQILAFAFMVNPCCLRGTATYDLANAVDVRRFQIFPIKV